ncbi:MAG TPA: class I SAM-dependent methyltransferase [Candidatus Kapabacteria bacterium]|nr:class I SAM-dependent methyltransferase [Candidatus Kapabacteria bacterium]
MTANETMHFDLIPNSLLQLLQSPDGNPLREEGDVLTDVVTGVSYSVDSGIPDLRPKKEKAQSEFDYQSHYQLDAEKFDYFEEHTGEHEHEERRVHEAITSYVPKQANAILDAGCGRAWVAEEYVKQGRFVCSMDISTGNPMEALRRFPSPKHAGLVADAFHLPIREGSFDVIIASEIIEHVTDPQGFVQSLFKALKPGGRLIISTPYKEKIRYTLCIHCNHATPLHSHIHSFDERKLLSYTPQGGRATWRTFGNKALFHLRTHPLLKRMPYKAWLAADTLANKAIDKRGHIVVVYEKVTA